ncbi:hypothetical protein [Paraflavitalea sp. CAU 1676]|uniref:hypothetical protein n=1 Tax=Paraflavitalea sp. CAU 1676 TaxID=3032598 RepID=UPI0023DAA8DF|nr:hypothetical protein [Paraflavitalea sp. CAU 1676]MDF2188885.1 hypothetical protein [Paraflavitalea sp. CAU 1676]
MILLHDSLGDAAPFLVIVLLVVSGLVFLGVFALLHGNERFARFMKRLWERSILLYFLFVLLLFVINTILVIVLAGFMLAYM